MWRKLLKMSSYLQLLLSKVIELLSQLLHLQVNSYYGKQLFITFMSMLSGQQAQIELVTSDQSV